MYNPIPTSESAPMLNEEGEEHYVARDEKSTRRTLFGRLRGLLSGKGASHKYSALGREGDGAAETSTQGFRGTVRTIFNYPEPGLELRGTAWLDGLRGLAAFEVFIFHYDDGWVDRTLGWGHGDYLDPAWWRLPFLRTFYASGDAAVCLFFAISGYVLSHRILSLYRQRRHDEAYSALSSAVFRRAIRLYMPVAIETFILMLLCRWFNFPKPVVYESAETFAGELNQYVISFVHLLVPLRYPDRWDYVINRYDGGISWTIPLEYYGSIVIFVVLLFVSRVRNMKVRLGLVLAMVWQSFIKDDWIAAQFLLGMAFADWQLDQAAARQHQSYAPSAPRRWMRTAIFWAIFLFGFYLAGLPLYHMKEGATPDTDALFDRPFYNWLSQPFAAWNLYRDRQFDRYLQCLAGYALLIGVGETPVLRRLTETRFVQYLGRISFGLYLCHIFLHACLKQLDPLYLRIVGLDPAVAPADRVESVQLFIAYLLMLVPSITVNFLVGGCFERFLDRPSVNMGKRFEKWCLARGKDDAFGPAQPMVPMNEMRSREDQETNSPITEPIRLT